MWAIPGDIILITENALENDDFGTLVATKGSTAVVLSFKEYSEQAGLNPLFRDEHLKMVKKWMEESYQYPVRFLTVAPVAESPDWSGDCVVGAITLLDGRFFRVIGRKEGWTKKGNW